MLGGAIRPVIRGSVDDVVILPLSEGTQFTLFSSSIDNVGNRGPLDSAMLSYVTLEFPIERASCPNNCSNSGNCTVFGDCVCEEGYYGSDCSQGIYLFIIIHSYSDFLFYYTDTPPPEPPIFEIPLSVTGVENEPLLIQIDASIPGTEEREGLVVYVDNLPLGSTFNQGREEGGRWIFNPSEFGAVELNLPMDYSGRLELRITATAAGASRQRLLVIDIDPIIEMVTPTTSTPGDGDTTTEKDVEGN